jgi:hypothetical protein
MEKYLITFKQFISENSSSVIAPDEAARKIFHDCLPFIKESDFRVDDIGVKNALFRGMESEERSRSFFKMMPRADRRPLDMSKDIHAVLDSFLKKHFGFPYRSAGVFAASDSRVAAEYGSVFMIFPIGEFSYVWSDSISDAYFAFDNSKGATFPKYWNQVVKYAKQHGINWTEDEVSSFNPDNKKWPESIALYLEDHPNIYIDDNLSEFLSSKDLKKHEIMLNCPSGYYAVPINAPDSNVEDILFYLRNIMENHAASA